MTEKKANVTNTQKLKTVILSVFLAVFVWFMVISPYFSFSTEILVVGIEITPDKLYSPVESISLTST